MSKLGQSATTTVERVPARAALAGNPSDGYGGAVFAIPVEACAATVTVTPAERWTISDELSGRRVFDSASALRDAADDVAPDEPHALLLATITEFLSRDRAPLLPCSIDVRSTIPMSVGLAGSSAIVIGTLRALYRAAGTVTPLHTPLASIALDVETQRLKITAGLQDRLTQTHGRPLLMRFDIDDENRTAPTPNADRCSVEVVEPGAELRFLIAHRPALSEPSHVVHGDLRRRFDGGDQIVRAAMSRLTAQALTARNAFVAGDAVALGGSMDATFDLRAKMIALSAGHVEMIDAARSAGASANYTGSGGAIVVLSRCPDVEAAARQSLKRLGCELVAVEVGSDPPSPSWSSRAPAGA